MMLAFIRNLFVVFGHTVYNTLLQVGNLYIIQMSVESSSDAFKVSRTIARINLSYEKFKTFLVYRSTRHGQVKRKNFPVTEACRFSSEICELNVLLNSLSGNRLANLVKFSYALKVVAKNLHKEEGIEAFETLVTTLLVILQDAEKCEEDNWKLLDENRELKKKVNSLEQVIAQIEASTSVDLSSLTMDDKNCNDDSFDSEYKEDAHMMLLSSVKECIDFSNRKDVFILETYIATPAFNSDLKTLVILFESSEQLEPPINSITKWRQISSCYSGDPPATEYDEWMTFATHQPDDHHQLLIDFVDPVCTRIISDYDDVVAVMPFAYRSDDTQPFEPALQIVKKVAGYYALCNRSPLPETNCSPNEYLELSNGRRLKVCEKDGWFYTHMNTHRDSSKPSADGGDVSLRNDSAPTISVGGGVSSPDSGNDYGSVGGFAIDKERNNYFVTCEHVIIQARKEELKKAVLLQSSKTKFVFPSEGPRKFQLMTAANAVIEKMNLNANFLRCLLNNFDTPAWKPLLNIDDDRDVTLRDIQQYLTNSHTSVTVENSDIYMYSSLPCELEYCSGIKILVHGDVAAVKLPADIFKELDEGSFKIQSKNVIGLFTMEAMFSEWTRGIKEIPVYKAGVNDANDRVEGSIMKPINVKAPLDDWFVSDYKSKTLKYDPNSLSDKHDKYKVLLGQYMVKSTRKFGRCGDSGGMVYCDATDGMFIVGTFVGSFDDNGTFVVSPAEVLMHRNNGCELSWMLHGAKPYRRNSK